MEKEKARRGIIVITDSALHYSSFTAGFVMNTFATLRTVHHPAFPAFVLAPASAYGADQSWGISRWWCLGG